LYKLNEFYIFCHFTTGKELLLPCKGKAGYAHDWTLRKEIFYTFKHLTTHSLVTIPTKNIVQAKLILYFLPSCFQVIVNTDFFSVSRLRSSQFNPLSPKLNPICYLLALLALEFLHVSRIRVKSLTLRLLMSYICMYVYIYINIYIYIYIYGAPFLMFLDHTQRRSRVGRTPLDERSARRRDL
jgi:hypothetical protein